MKKLHRFSSIAALMLTASVVCPSKANAAVSLRADVMVLEGTVYQASSTLAYNTTGTVLPPNVASASASGGSSHEWAPGEFMTFTGSGSAEAFFQYGSFVPFALRASATGSLTNTFYDSANDGQEVVPDGAIPPVYVVQARAQITDTLAYGGTATSYNSRYIFRLTGTITGDESFVAVFMKHGLETQSWTIYDVGTYDQIIVSDAYVNSPNLEFGLSILAHFQPNTQFLPDGENVSGSANFGNTLELIGIDARDSNGNLIDGNFTTSEGGTIPIMAAPVPEPAVGLLAVSAFTALLARRRS